MTVKMVRSAEVYPAPHSVEVHPDEVENYRAGGFVPVEDEAPKRTRKKKADVAGEAEAAPVAEEAPAAAPAVEEAAAPAPAKPKRTRKKKVEAAPEAPAPEAEAAPVEAAPVEAPAAEAEAPAEKPKRTRKKADD